MHSDMWQYIQYIHSSSHFKTGFLKMEIDGTVAAIVPVIIPCNQQGNILFSMHTFRSSLVVPRMRIHSAVESCLCFVFTQNFVSERFFPMSFHNRHKSMTFQTATASNITKGIFDSKSNKNGELSILCL